MALSHLLNHLPNHLLMSYVRSQVEYSTMNDSAMAGADYVMSQGKLVFESGQKSCQVNNPVPA